MPAEWSPAPAALALTPDSIDVFRVPLEELLLGEHYALLSDAETRRAGNYASPKKAREFIITRGALRRVLAHALDQNPRAFCFEYETHGRPYLADQGGHDGVSFSVSHSHDLALIALTRGRRVGIDIERVRYEVDHESLSRRFFSSAEYQALRCHHNGVRLRAFFAVWTRKEALVKATGTGIAGGLKAFDVSADPDSPAELLATRWEDADPSNWLLTDICADPDYLACVAADGQTQVRCWTLASAGRA